MKSPKVLLLLLIADLVFTTSGCLSGGDNKSRPTPQRLKIREQGIKRPTEGSPQLSPSQLVKPERGKVAPRVGQFSQ